MLNTDLFPRKLNLGNRTTNDYFQELCGPCWGGEGWAGPSGETRFSSGLDCVRLDANKKPPTPAGFFQVSQTMMCIWLVSSTDEGSNVYFCSVFQRKVKAGIVSTSRFLKPVRGGSWEGGGRSHRLLLSTESRSSALRSLLGGVGAWWSDSWKTSPVLVDAPNQYSATWLNEA